MVALLKILFKWLFSTHTWLLRLRNAKFRYAVVGVWLRRGEVCCVSILSCTARDVFLTASERALLPTYCSSWSTAVRATALAVMGLIAPSQPGAGPLRRSGGEGRSAQAGRGPCRHEGPERPPRVRRGPRAPPGGRWCSRHAGVAPSGAAAPAGTVPNPPAEGGSGKWWWQRARTDSETKK